jgi:hypothetical protein
MSAQRNGGPTVVGTRHNAEGFRFGLEEDARVVRSVMREMPLPAARTKQRIDTVRDLEQLAGSDDSLILGIADCNQT